jgi:hypothetical protein
MKLAEDVADLVTGHPRWAEKRNDFIRWILELHRKKEIKEEDKWKRRGLTKMSEFVVLGLQRYDKPSGPVKLRAPWGKRGS